MLLLPLLPGKCTPVISTISSPFIFSTAWSSLLREKNKRNDKKLFGTFYISLNWEMIYIVWEVTCRALILPWYRKHLPAADPPLAAQVLHTFQLRHQDQSHTIGFGLSQNETFFWKVWHISVGKGRRAEGEQGQPCYWTVGICGSLLSVFSPAYTGNAKTSVGEGISFLTGVK